MLSREDGTDFYVYTGGIGLFTRFILRLLRSNTLNRFKMAAKWFIYILVIITVFSIIKCRPSVKKFKNGDKSSQNGMKLTSGINSFENKQHSTSLNDSIENDASLEYNNQSLNELTELPKLGNLTKLLFKYPQYENKDLNLSYVELTHDIKSLEENNITKDNSFVFQAFNSTNKSEGIENLQEIFENLNKTLVQINNDVTTNNKNIFTVENNRFLLVNEINKVILHQNNAIENIHSFISNFTDYDLEFKGVSIHNQDHLLSAINKLEADFSQFRGNFTKLRNKIEKIEQDLEVIKGDSRGRCNIQSDSNDKHITAKTCNGPQRHLIGNSCYYVPKPHPQTDLFTWWDGRYHCKEVLGNQGDLVVIDNEKELNDVIDMLATHFGDLDDVWFGASNLNHFGDTRWRWVNGHELDIHSFLQWISGVSLQGVSSCMSFYNGYQLNAEPCFYTRHPLCELKLV